MHPTLARRQCRPVLALHPPLVVDAGQQHLRFSVWEFVVFVTCHDAATGWKFKYWILVKCQFSNEGIKPGSGGASQV